MTSQPGQPAPASPAVPREESSLRAARPLRLLALASGVCVGMVLVRFAYVGSLRFRFSGLLLNLSLAWIPVGLALLVRSSAARGHRVRLGLAAAAWLLFFPNTFYLTTDLIHTNRFGLDRVYWWYDQLMTVGFAAAGMFLGSVSLYLVHTVVQQRHGRGAGWAFAATAVVLGSFGVYLGRFLRFNSWDVFVHPGLLAREIFHLAQSAGRTEVMVFCAAFSAYSLAIYCFVLAIAQLHPPPERDRP